MIDIVSVTDTVTTPAGTYANCLKTRDYTPLEPGLEEFKWHCPGVGLARETGPGFEIVLQSVGSGASPTAVTSAPTAPAASMTPDVAAPNTGAGPSSASGIEAWMVAAFVVAMAIGSVGLYAALRQHTRS